MKNLLKLTILIIILTSCSNKNQSKGQDSPKTEIRSEIGNFFREVSGFPTIKDTTLFISDIRKNIGFKLSEYFKPNEKITAYRKVKLNGSDKDYIFVEYDYKSGSMAAYPWKLQLILTTKGKLIKLLQGQRYDFVSIFPNENPFLLIVTATAKGNGGHEIYKISADTLENVYEGYYDYNVQTYDAHQDLSVFEPNELNIQFFDENKDGYNDIIFSGNKLMLSEKIKKGIWNDFKIINGKEVPFTVKNPAKKIPIKFIFLYDKLTGHFKAKENYSKKYNLSD